MTTTQAHIGTVLPHQDGFTWQCLCGRRPTDDNVWATYDAAAAALARHTSTAGRRA